MWCAGLRVRNHARSRRATLVRNLVVNRVQHVHAGLTQMHTIRVPASFDRCQHLFANYRKPYRITSQRFTLAGFMSDRTGRMKKYIGFGKKVFLKHIYAPLNKELVRITEGKLKRRAYQLSNFHRIVRWIRLLRGSKVADLVEFFGQSQSTVNRDCKLLSHLFIATQYVKWVHPMATGSPEYLTNRGSGNFLGYPNAVYAGDIVQVQIPKPTLKQSFFYSYKHKCHSLGFMVAVDSRGLARLVAGPCGGVVNDVTFMKNSKLEDKLKSMVATGDTILYDGAFKSLYADLYTTPIISRGSNTYMALHPSTVNLHDKCHRSARVIVENYFGGLKSLFPIWRYYQWNAVESSIHFRVCVGLYQIFLLFEAALRPIKCQNDDCFVCYHTL